MAANNAVPFQIMIVSAGHAYCYTPATNVLLEVTAQLAGMPAKVFFADGYFGMLIAQSQTFQFSNPLDGTTWPGVNLSEVSVFPENITTIGVDHRELVILGEKQGQLYQDTGSVEIYDPVAGGFIEQGAAALFATDLVDSATFWLGQNKDGQGIAWRLNGVSPLRISNHAVESAWERYASITNAVSYSYVRKGHTFWVIYFPTANPAPLPTSATWVYDAATGLWHEWSYWRADLGRDEAHHSWWHQFAFNQHLVGDWSTGNIYQLSPMLYTDAGNPIRRVRRAPHISKEKEPINFDELTVDFESGVGPQPPLLDGLGNPRPPQAMLRWSNDGGKTWSNEQTVSMGAAGESLQRAVWRRLGQARRGSRVFELAVSDPVWCAIVDAYLKADEFQPSQRFTKQWAEIT